MTKKEYIARKERWAKALAEGRVVSYNDGQTMKAYPTVAQAQEMVAVANAEYPNVAKIIKLPDGEYLVTEA